MRVRFSHNHEDILNEYLDGEIKKIELVDSLAGFITGYGSIYYNPVGLSYLIDCINIKGTDLTTEGKSINDVIESQESFLRYRINILY